MHGILYGLGALLLLPPAGQVMEPYCGVAFEADYEKVVVTIESDGRRTESRELYRLYRDARGRSRMEGFTPAGQGEMLHFAFIVDLQNLRAVVLDLATGKPLKFKPWRPSDGPQQPAAEATPPKQEPQTVDDYTVVDLGEAQIEGLAARGGRTTTASSVREVWQARLIDQPPLLVRSKQPAEERTERLFNIRLVDPDPSLFAPLDAPKEQNQ